MLRRTKKFIILLSKEEIEKLDKIVSKTDLSRNQVVREAMKKQGLI